MDRKFFILTGILIIFSLTMIIMDLNNEMSILENFVLPRYLQFSRINDFFDKRREMKDEVLTLKKEIAQLSYKQWQWKSLKNENERLRAILDFKNEFPGELVVCEVLNKVPQAVNRSFFISRGHESGIEEDDAVIGLKGIFGKIIKAGENNSIVQTIANYNISISAVDRRSREAGILKWDRNFYLEGLPLYADIQIGDTVVTSGKGSVFSRGLRIGRIISVDKEKSDYSLRVIVEPFENFRNPEVVFVIK